MGEPISMIICVVFVYICFHMNGPICDGISVLRYVYTTVALWDRLLLPFAHVQPGAHGHKDRRGVDC
jgi:hypothetical protein